jgi:hypothetical protein
MQWILEFFKKPAPNPKVRETLDDDLRAEVISILARMIAQASEALMQRDVGQ